jgi:nicotinamide riboside transporter PnuC
MKADFLGTISAIIGALIIALNIGYNYIGFGLFLISNIFYIIYSLEKEIRNLNIFFMNLVFAIINIIGIFNYFKI